MIIESAGDLERQIRRLEVARDDCLGDLEAIYDGWVQGCAEVTCKRLHAIDRDLSVLRSRLEAANSRVKLYKGKGIYITQ